MTRDVTLEDVFTHELEVSMREQCTCGGLDLNQEHCDMLNTQRIREVDRQLFAEHVASEHAERRERIATAALQGLLHSYPSGGGPFVARAARDAVEYADALIAELDKVKA